MKHSKSLRRTVLLLSVSAGSLAAHAQQSFLGSDMGSTAPAVAPVAPAPAAAPVAPAPPDPEPAPFSMPRNFHMAPSVIQSSVPDKVSYYLRSTVSVRNFAEAFAVAGIPNIVSAPSQPIAPANPGDLLAAGIYEKNMEIYGDEMDNWRRTNEEILRYHADRLETGFATAETRQLLSNLVLPMAFGQTARFVPAPVDATLGEHLWNAVSSIVVTHSDSGALVPNYSKLGGTVGAALIGKMVFSQTFNAPELDSNHFFTRYVGYSLAGDLATNTLHEMVRATTAPDLAMYQLHGNAHDESYYPLSLGGKLMYWARSTYSVRNFAAGALLAGMPVVTTQPVEPQPGIIASEAEAVAYNEAYETWGTAELTWKRSLENQLHQRARAFIGGFSESETQMFLSNLVLPVSLDMDPRYLPLGPGHSAGARMGHALRGLVFTNSDAGNQVINVPVLGGTVGAAFAAKEIYYPLLGTQNLESGSVLGKTISLNLLADAVGNLYSEFFSSRRF